MTDWERCAPWLQAALDRDPTHTLEQVKELCASGECQFWPGERCAGVGEIIDHPLRRDYSVWLVGGDLDDIRKLEAAAVAFAKTMGCKRITCAGRPGWKALGYTPAHVVLVKEL